MIALNFLYFILGALIWLVPLFFLIASHFSSRHDPNYFMAFLMMVLIVVGIEWRFSFSWLTLLKAGGIYIGIGLLYTLLKWKSQINLIFRSFQKGVIPQWKNCNNKNGAAQTPNVYEFALEYTDGISIKTTKAQRFWAYPSKEELIQSFTPNFSDNTEKLTGWAVFWMFSLVGDFFNMHFISLLLNPFKTLGQKIADHQFGKFDA